MLLIGKVTQPKGQKFIPTPFEITCEFHPYSDTKFGTKIIGFNVLPTLLVKRKKACIIHGAKGVLALTVIKKGKKEVKINSKTKREESKRRKI